MTEQASAANPIPPDRRGSRVFLRIMRLLRPQWGMIALGMLLLLASVPGELFPALVWKYAVDDLIVPTVSHHPAARPTPVLAVLFSLDGRLHNPFALLTSALIWLFLIYESGELLGTLSSNLLNRVAQKFIFGFRNRVYHKLQSQSLGYLQRQRLGDLISRAMSDVDELQAFIVNGVDQIIGDGILWLATVIVLMLINWKVASVSLAPLMVVYVLLRVFNAKIKPIYTAARERLGDVTTRLQENLSGLVVIKIFSREKPEAQRFHDATEAYYQQQIKAINARSIFFSISRTVGFFSMINMLGMGGYLILRGGSGFTIGKLVVFRAYWWRLYGPVQTLARVNDMVQRAIAAGRRVFEILDAPDELPDSADARQLVQVTGGMSLRHVTFRYPNEVNGRESPIVLRDLSLQIEPGQTVALCGPSGSGKSTILNLLLRFYDPLEGQITLDGFDLRQIRRDSFRRHFALVQQETFLFNDSIFDNICYGHAEATMEQVVAAARAANAHAFISALPNGYDTKVGERGVRLSGGQKQRISIARAFLANPTVLLLDEPTSSVEPDSEAAIIAALDRLMAGRTTVLTSHRPSLINQADTVYVIQDGRVTEHGSRRDLAASEGWFARFMRSAEEALPEMAE